MALVAEVGHGRQRAGQHDHVRFVQHRAGGFGEIGQAIEIGQAAAALGTRREGLGIGRRAQRGAQPGGGTLPAGAQTAGRPPASQQEQDLARGLQPRGARRQVGSGRRFLAGIGTGDFIAAGLAHLEIGRENDGRALPAARQAGAHGVPPGPRGVPRAGYPVHPARHRPRQRLDVGGQRRIERQMPAHVVADQVDDGRMGAPGVVQVGDSVGKAGPQMQQRGRRRAAHAAVAVGAAGADVLLQAQHAAHAGHGIERPHDVQFRRAGIGETHLHAFHLQGRQQGLRSSRHVELLFFSIIAIR